MINSKRTVIMHMSDIHFGIPEKRQNSSDRKNVQDSFINSYAEFIKANSNWAPDILVISGDIAWNGSIENFRQAEKFFEKFFMIEGNKILPSQVVVCFGNHDTYVDKYLDISPNNNNMAYDKGLPGYVERPAQKLNSNSEEWEMNNNDVLTIEDVEKYYHRFKNIEEFCNNMGFVNLNNFTSDSKYKHAYGSCSVKGVDFICLNTEWDFWGSKDKTAEGHLRIGSRIYHSANKFLYNFKPFIYGTPPRIVVYHRRLEHLHGMEQFSVNPDKFDSCVGNLIFRNDVSLSGHEHVHRIGKYGAHTCIQAGAMHSTDCFEYNCNLIAIPKKLKPGLNDCEVRKFSYNPGNVYNPWQMNKSEYAEHFYIVRLRNIGKISTFIDAVNSIQHTDTANLKIVEDIYPTLSEEEKKVLASILSDEVFQDILGFVKASKQTKSEIVFAEEENISALSNESHIIDGLIENGRESNVEESLNKEFDLVKTLVPPTGKGIPINSESISYDHPIISKKDDHKIARRELCE